MTTTAEDQQMGTPGLSREQVLDRIISINTSATMDFLNRFSDRALNDYLEHLQITQTPRGPHSRWVRRADTPAIIARESDD